MKTIFETCQPRPEVLEGSLSEDIFAARLKDVVEHKGEEVYRNAELFFENTYMTSGLKTLVVDALSRLAGDATGKNAFIRLETSFGGGKTHNLIALYHLATGAVPKSVYEKFMGKKFTPITPKDILVASVVGSEQSPADGIEHEDGSRTYTLWGEIAYQLGGQEGLALVEKSESLRAAEGTAFLEKLIGDKPALIMLDEVSRQLRGESAIPTATGKTTQADQTIAFLLSLLEFAASKERCLVVMTLASDTDAFSQETQLVRQKIIEAMQVSARQERALTPTTSDEIYSIVTHRLFRSIDRKSLRQILNTYSKYYAELVEKGVDLPQKCLRAEYVQEMESSYPFHPELLNTLSLKTATIPNFNQTRGALRLLAWTIRSLWDTKPKGTWLIHPYHLNLGNPKIAEDLTTRLDRPKFKQVIEADIVNNNPGSQAHAQELDQQLIASKKPNYTQRLATTIFLHSLTQGTASGASISETLLGVLTPDDSKGGDDAAVVSRSLEKLMDHAWFMEYDGHRYRFQTEPSINKIIADEMLQVGVSKAKAELDSRIRQIWKKGFLEPKYFPSEPSDVENDAGAPKLAIIHYDAVTVTAAKSQTPDLVKRIYEYSGLQESFRTFQNNVLFLAADAEQADNMLQVARRYLAIVRITGDSERMQQFTKEQRDKLKAARDTAELDVRIAITKAYRYLYYPSSEAGKNDSHLRRETLPAQEQGDVEKDQTNVILRVLRALNKVITSDDEALPAMYVKSKAWDLNQESITTEELRKAFARKIGLRMLLDVNQLKKTIKNGVETKVWIYYDAEEGFGYDHESPPTAWKIGDDYTLYTPAEAKKLGIRIKGKWTPETESGKGVVEEALCPVCKRPESQCICGAEVQSGRKPAKLTGDGPVNQAFQQIIDQCSEFDIEKVERLYIKIEGMGKPLANGVRSLGLAIPQFGKGRFSVEQTLTASYGEKKELFKSEFEGSWDRYKRLKGVVEPFLTEADELRCMMRVAGEFEAGLDVTSSQFTTIRDVLNTLDLGRVFVEAIPAKNKEQ